MPSIDVEQRITGVAAISEDGRMWALPRPSRHHHLFSLAAFMGDDPNPCDTGFITSNGKYVDRKEALVIAAAANQIVKKHGNANMLFSEDMW